MIDEKQKLKHTFDLFSQAITKLDEAKVILYNASDMVIGCKLPIELGKIHNKQINISELIDYLEKAKLNITKLLGE